MIALALLSTLLSFPTLTPAAIGPVVFSDRFDDPTLARWSDRQRAATDRISVIRAPGRTGSAVRFVVRQGDRGFPADTGNRSELAWWDRIVHEGDQSAYRWTMLFPPSYPVSRRWQDVVQWKNEGPGTPPLQMSVRGNCLALTTGPQFGSRALWRTRLLRGRWLRFVMRVHWSSRPATGAVTMTYGGKRVLNGVRLPTLYSGRGNYLKLGLYRDPRITLTGTVYFDDIIVRQSQVPSPLPWSARAQRLPAGRC